MFVIVVGNELVLNEKHSPREERERRGRGRGGGEERERRGRGRGEEYKLKVRMNNSQIRGKVDRSL
jgi:hypothetical protein